MSRSVDQLAALAEVSALLERRGFDHWLFGGWAVDFHVGAITREHEDVDLAVRQEDASAIGSLLADCGWRHAPEPDEDGGTGYERGSARVELTYLVVDEAGRRFVPLRRGNALFAEDELGDERRELHGVSVRVIPFELLRAGKSVARTDPVDAAKDRADVDALERR